MPPTPGRKMWIVGNYTTPRHVTDSVALSGSPRQMEEK